jgi:mono/diheme cytochrome c family protein
LRRTTILRGSSFSAFDAHQGPSARYRLSRCYDRNDREGKIVSAIEQSAGRLVRACAPAIALAACLVSSALPAVAQTAPDAKRGHELAARLCTNCHVIDRQASGSVRADVPTFRVIANRSGVTAERIAGAIIIPHPAMPGVQLTTPEIRDLVAYILSLKQN